MRLFFVLTFLAVATVACSQKQKAQVKQIEWSKVSRGSEEHIRINADSVFVIANDSKGMKAPVNFARKTQPEEWVNLVLLVQNLAVKDISSLTSPTMNRAHDGAMHSTITIQISDTKEYAHGFDDENPHEYLVTLLAEIKKISGRKE